MKLPAILAAIAAVAALSGCASGGLFKNYPGALNEGKPITIQPYAMEGYTRFCVWGLSVELDQMPEAAGPLDGDKPYCATVLNEQKERRYRALGPRSFFPVLDYSTMTVRFKRSADGPWETHVLSIKGKLTEPIRPDGRIYSIRVVTTETGVFAERHDMEKDLSRDHTVSFFIRTVLATSESPGASGSLTAPGQKK